MVSTKKLCHQDFLSNHAFLEIGGYFLHIQVEGSISNSAQAPESTTFSRKWQVTAQEVIKCNPQFIKPNYPSIHYRINN